jgi:NAD(P)-dependent dehydrogenase (short-subunit alcohol dehydrogenase family)
MDIKRSVALVTGGNRGFGKSLVAELLARGATVYAAARDPETVKLDGAIPIQLDVTDPASVAAAAQATGNVTLLINNAGSATGASLLSGSIEDIRTEMDTHFYGTRAFAPQLAAAGGGAMLNVLSALSWFSLPSTGAYCAAKSAEWSLTNSLRQELAAQGTQVCSLHVGYMDTDMTRGVTSPKIDPAEVASLALDELAAGQVEILADDLSKRLREGLAGGVAALYPQFA